MPTYVILWLHGIIIKIQKVSGGEVMEEESFGHSSGQEKSITPDNASVVPIEEPAQLSAT